MMPKSAKLYIIAFATSMCTYVRCVVRCCANLKFTIRLFLVCEQRAITIVVKKERVESMVPKILELSDVDFFYKNQVSACRLMSSLYEKSINKGKDFCTTFGIEKNPENNENTNNRTGDFFLSDF